MKADPDSASMRRLEVASNAVRKATDNLVKAAQQALENEEEPDNVNLNRSAVNTVVEVFISTHLIGQCLELYGLVFRRSTRGARCSAWSASLSRHVPGWRSCTRGATRRTQRLSSRGKKRAEYLVHGFGFPSLNCMAWF